MRTIARFFDTIVGGISLAAAAIAAFLLLAMFVVVQYEVVMRYWFGRPTHWTHEVTTFAIAWVGFLSAGYLLRQGRQLEIDIVTSRLSAGARRLLGTFTDIIGAAFCGYTVLLGYRFVSTAHMMGATNASELDTPLWIPYSAIPIGFTILGLEFLARILNRWGLTPERSDDPHSSTAI
ncbi:MAG: TRAP transporter small permease [Hyphomicrobiaceae bacterium]|nr:TRAP transporter small permease [Hyphomicrobiaceae bacterium]